MKTRTAPKPHARIAPEPHPGTAPRPSNPPSDLISARTRGRGGSVPEFWGVSRPDPISPLELIQKQESWLCFPPFQPPVIRFRDQITPFPAEQRSLEPPGPSGAPTDTRTTAQPWCRPFPATALAARPRSTAGTPLRPALPPAARTRRPLPVPPRGRCVVGHPRSRMGTGSAAGRL